MTTQQITLRSALLFACTMLLGMWLLLVPTTHAQTCTSLVIQNESSVILDEERICEVAKPLADKGLEIYLYLTDDSFSSEDTWFKRLDNVEIAWGIYNPDNDSFWKNSFTIELSTDTSSFVSQNIGVGDSWGTKLYSKRDSLKGVLRNTLRAEGATEAIVKTLEETYTLAFPAPTPIVNQVTKKEVSVDTKPIAEGALKILSIFAIIFILTLIILFIGIPVVRRLIKRIRFSRHISLLSERTVQLLNEADKVFNEQILYELWKSHGGNHDKNHNDKVLSYLKTGKQELSDAFKVWKELENSQPSFKDSSEETEKYIKDLETIYITIVGSSNEILNMTKDEQKSLFDPYGTLAGKKIGGNTSTQSKIQTVLRRHQGAGGLQLTLLKIKPEEKTTAGILGYILKIKKEIEGIKHAKKTATDDMEYVDVLINLLHEHNIPHGFKLELVIEPISKMLNDVKMSQEKQQWYEMHEKIQTLLFVLKQIPSTLNVYANAWNMIEKVKKSIKGKSEILLFPNVERVTEPLQKMYYESVKNFSSIPVEESQSHATKIEKNASSLENKLKNFVAATSKKLEAESFINSLIKNGYTKKHFIKDTKMMDTVAKKTSTAFLEGNYLLVNELIALLISTAENAQKKAQSISELKEDNTKRIRELSKHVAKIEKNRQNTLGFWIKLQKYPKVNWKDVSTYFDEADVILKELFDNPKDKEDLSSKIEQKNSMKQQCFEKAEDMLDTAIAKAYDAQKKLAEIGMCLNMIEKLENTLSKGLDIAGKNVLKLIRLRDKHNATVDTKVDVQIIQAKENVQKAYKLINKKLFIPADILLQETQQIIQSSLESITSQVEKTAELFQRLNRIKNNLESYVKSTPKKYMSLVDSAKNPRTGENLAETLRFAELFKIETQQLSSKEDKELRNALNSLISQGGGIESNFVDLEGKIREDSALYKEKVDIAELSIIEAKNSIRKARVKVNNSDADGAGSRLLSQAMTLVSISILNNDSFALLSKKEKQADEAKRYALRAEQKATEAIDEAEEEREEEQERARRRSNYGGYSSTPWSSGGSSSGGSGFGSSIGRISGGFGGSMGRISGGFGSSIGRR